MRVVILDGYVDEPSNFGVPPFVSPYPRYLAGAVADAGYEWEYVTIDRVRAGHPLNGDLLAIISASPSTTNKMSVVFSCSSTWPGLSRCAPATMYSELLVMSPVFANASATFAASIYSTGVRSIRGPQDHRQSNRPNET